MRAGAVVSIMLASSPLAALGCIDRDPSALHDPGELGRAREENIPVDRVAPASRATSRTVRCGCDADANLHIAAPPGSKVSRPEDASQAAEAQIVLPEDAPSPRPIRVTRSLGFIGDNKLTPSVGHGGPWAAPDAVLPKHHHASANGYSGYYGHAYGYRSYGYRLR
jgi:hypothetical protein